MKQTNEWETDEGTYGLTNMHTEEKESVLDPDVAYMTFTP